MITPLTRLEHATFRGARRLLAGKGRMFHKVSRKKTRRALMGWLRPIRCPGCRQYTRQVKVRQGLAGGALVRQCLSCRLEFTRAESRQRLR